MGLKLNDLHIIRENRALIAIPYKRYGFQMWVVVLLDGPYASIIRSAMSPEMALTFLHEEILRENV